MPRSCQAASRAVSAAASTAVANTLSAGSGGSASPATARSCVTAHVPIGPAAKVNRRGDVGAIIGAELRVSGNGSDELQRQGPGPFRPRADQLAVLEIARVRAGDGRQPELQMRAGLRDRGDRNLGAALVDAGERAGRGIGPPDELQQ